MELNAKNIKKILIIIGASVLMFWGIMNISLIFSAIKWIINILSPFIIGFCFAFVVNLVLRPLEACWDRIFGHRSTVGKKLKRPICLTLCILLALGAVVAIFFIIIPEVSKTMKIIIEALPEYFNSVKGFYNSMVEFFANYAIVLPEFTLDDAKILKTLTDFLSQSGQTVFNQTINTTAAIVSAIFNLVVGIAFSIYLLSGKERLLRQLKKTIFALTPPEKAKKIFSFSTRVNRSFTNFVTGQMLESIIMGFLCFIGMLIFRMPYASVVSVLIGVTALVPIFGSFIGTAVGAFLILVVSPVKAFWFVIFIIVLQQLEGNLIYPNVVGKSVGLPGIWVLVAVTLGGSIFGIGGMLISVPVCSVAYIYASEKINYLVTKRKNEALKPKETPKK